MKSFKEYINEVKIEDIDEFTDDLGDIFDEVKYKSNVLRCIYLLETGRGYDASELEGELEEIAEKHNIKIKSTTYDDPFIEANIKLSSKASKEDMSSFTDSLDEFFDEVKVKKSTLVNVKYNFYDSYFSAKDEMLDEIEERAGDNNIETGNIIVEDAYIEIIAKL